MAALHIFDDKKAYHHKVANSDDGYSKADFSLHYLAIVEPSGDISWLAQGGKRSQENLAEMNAALPGNLIPFTVYKQWPAGMNILVDSKAKKADVIRLAQSLFAPHKDEHFYLIRVFDNKEALASLDDMNSNYPENKFWLHNLLQISNNNVDHGKMNWFGQGRKY